MTHENDGYRAYLVRLWPAQCGGQEVWRISVEDARTGERHAFVGLDQLSAFLREALYAKGEPPEGEAKLPSAGTETSIRGE
jgi:hypothetical protein